MAEPQRRRFLLMRSLSTVAVPATVPPTEGGDRSSCLPPSHASEFQVGQEQEFTADLKVSEASTVKIMALAQLIVWDAFIGNLAGRFKQMCQ